MVILVRTHFNLIEVAYVRVVFRKYDEMSERLKALAVFAFF